MMTKNNYSINQSWHLRSYTKTAPFDLFLSYGLPIAWSVIVAVVLTWLFAARGFDDPYITYRYAEQIANGHGFVYNTGESVLSTTTPLYALVLAIFGWVGLDIPLISNSIGAVSLAIGGLALWGMGRTWGMPLAGIAALLIYPTFPLLIMTLGAETLFLLALILCGMLAVAHKRLYLAAVLFALATLTRADAILAMGIAIVYILISSYREEQTPPWGPLVVYAGFQLPWLIYAWITFGSIFPSTLVAKQQQGTMAISESFFAGLIQQIVNHWAWHAPIYWIYFVLAAIGLIYVVGMERRWLLVVGWSLLYMLAYTLLGVTSYFWYYAPVVVGAVVLVAVGVEIVAFYLSEYVQKLWIARILQVVMMLALIAPQVVGIITLYLTPDHRMSVYQDIGEWLNTYTPPDATVGVLEVGVIGYYADRHMIDFAGLLQPETANHFSHDATYEDVALWAFERFSPSYLVLHDGMFAKLEQSDAFVRRCMPVKQFDHTPHAFVVYACGK
jgi:hypothetical protein